MSRVKVRLVTTIYVSHLEWEDGPGSMQNVVSDSSVCERQEVDSLTMAEAKALSYDDLRFEYGLNFEEDSPDGFEEFNFALQYLNEATGKWCHLKSISK
ncbi:MAG TPA: hypothetical protein VLA77_02715 [Candidatus Saccharimonadales bacterium]|nr:hypothetical protein [Candidatus Saccharimonadales bacterium]